MKNLKNFENFKYENDEPVNEVVFESIGLASGIFFAYIIYSCVRDTQDGGERMQSFADKIAWSVSKVISFFKTAPSMIVNKVKDVVDEIKSLGLHEEVDNWITDNLINNGEIKSLQSKIQELRGTEREVEIEDLKRQISEKAKILFEKLKSEDVVLHRALMRTMEKLEESGTLVGFN